jgi:enoyl-CoA hydratase/carnithine racemase
MEFKTLSYACAGQLGRLTLNRPAVVNAINGDMLDELVRFWRERQDDTEARVIIMQGAGEKGFCSGLDMKDVARILSGADGAMTVDRMYTIQSRFSSIVRLMRSCPQPVIAAVHGHAMGGGLSLALASDVRLASRDAQFCAQYINIGLGGADMGTSYFIWRVAGWGRAAEMCLTGDRVPAEEAFRIGLVNHLYGTREEMAAAAESFAEKMLSKNPLALRLTKEALNAGLDLSSLESANRIEDRNQAFLLAGGAIKTK